MTIIEETKLKKRKRAKRGKIKTLKIKYSVTFVVFNEKKNPLHILNLTYRPITGKILNKIGDLVATRFGRFRMD
jgi:hypothetical protein